MAISVFALVLQPAYDMLATQVAHAVGAPGSVVINEVKPSSVGGTDRWIELYNTTGSDIDISNWRIVRGSNNFGAVIASASIPAHGFYTISSTSETLPQTSATPIELWDGSASTGTKLDEVVYAGVAVGQSYGRIADGSADFQVFATPTKNATNVPAPTIEQNTVCATGCEYTTIQAAVNGEAVGATILVKDGTYNESVNINKSLTIKAQSTNVRVIGGPGYSNGAFLVNAANVTIDGFTIGHASSMIGTIGVELSASSGAVVKNNIIEHNQRGISLAGASNITLDGNTIRDNNANPENNAGIWGDAVTGITIANSQFSGASNTSINLAGSSSITLKGNTFTSGANAAVIWGDNDVTLEDNLLSGLSSTGFFITGTSGLTATNNTLAATTTGTSGFSISTTSGTPSTNISLTHNKITGYTNGLTVSAGAVNSPVQASGNWWGSASGPKDTAANDDSTPAVNTAGTGTVVNGAANYNSWCLTDACTEYFALAAPTELTPANSTITKDRNFSMTWNTVPGAAVYEYRTANTVADPTTLGPVIYSDSSSSSNYTINGTTVTRGNNGTPDADYYWQVRAGDGSGTWGPWSEIRKVTVDNVAPTSTNNLGSLVQGTLTIRQTVTDTTQPASGKLRIWKQNADGSLDNSKFYASANTVPVDGTGIASYALNTATQLYGDGKYTAKFTARDAAGNESVQEKVFTVDNTVPTVTVKSGAIGNTTSKIFSNISFSLYDAYQVDKYVLNGQTVDFTNNNWSDANFQNIKSKLVQGANTFVLYDVAGNTTTYSFTYDSVAPTTPVHEAPVADAVQSSNDFWFDWSDVSDAVSYEMQNSQNPATSADGSFTNVQWTGDYQQIQPTESRARSVGANGTWYWQVRAVDAAGNRSPWTTPWKVTIDQEKPAAPVLQVNGQSANYLYTNQYNVLASWTVPSSDTVKYDYKYWNNIATSAYNSETAAWYNNSLAGTSYAGVFNQGEGEQYVQVRAVDAAGNLSDWSNKVTIVYDKTAPTVSLTSLSDGQVIRGDTQIRMSAADQNLAAYSYRIRKVNADNSNTADAPIVDKVITSTNNITDQAVFTWDTSLLGDGKYFVYVSARDKAGNRTEQRIYVTVDATAPIPTIVSAVYAPGTPPAVDTIEVAVTTDEVASAVSIRYNNTEYPATFDSESGHWKASIPAGSLTGQRPLFVTATDTAGNTRTPATEGSVIVPVANSGASVSGDSGTNGGANPVIASVSSAVTPSSATLAASTPLLAVSPLLATGPAIVATSPLAAAAPQPTDTDTVASVQGAATNSIGRENDTKGEVKAAEDTKASWSLGNLILASVAVLAGLMALLGLFRRRATDETTQTALRAVAVIIAAVSSIAYLLTSDFSAPMTWFTAWSLAYAAAAAMQIAIVASLKRAAE